ncbi:hypothetical protein N752_11650 [Desulforamulus aquiferis]|nr:PadR family transcriptional regulator [Desulforamulus aquiferis]RYD05011.1 hypothetical protein N752_11650 [Desulforamulus aquiferis]
MSLAHALLGLVRYQPSTGYQLKDNFQHSIHFIWNATLPQIYRTLNQMENQGWLRAEIVTQVGKPNRKVYHITEEGLKEFHRWLNEPMEPLGLKDSTLIKVFFGNGADPEQFDINLQKLRDYYTEQLNIFQLKCSEIIQNEVKKHGCPSEGVYWDLSVDFGVRWSKMIVEWCEHAQKVHKELKG